MLGLDPLFATILVTGGLLLLGYLVGRRIARDRLGVYGEYMVASTIDRLVQDGFIFSTRDSDGDEVLVPLKDLTSDEQRRAGINIASSKG